MVAQMNSAAYVKLFFLFPLPQIPRHFHFTEKQEEGATLFMEGSKRICLQSIEQSNY